MYLPGRLSSDLLVLCCAASVFAQTAFRSAAPPQSETSAEPQTSALAQQPLSGSDEVRGLISLDVVVTDNSGKPVSGLRREDFSLLDNGEPQKIISFREFDGSSTQTDPLVRVILVIDTIKTPEYLASFERGQSRGSCVGTAVI